MKFLIDRCAGRRLADWLREQGHDVVESRERGEDPGDQTLLEWATAEQRILVTIDKDFGQRGRAEKRSAYRRLGEIQSPVVCQSPMLKLPCARAPSRVRSNAAQGHPFFSRKH